VKEKGGKTRKQQRQRAQKPYIDKVREGETHGCVKIPSFLCWNMSWRQQAGLESQHLNSISLRAESLPERDVRGTTICLCSDVSAVHAVSQQLQGKAASWPGPT